MINLGIKYLLPATWKAVAWIDEDIEFEDEKLRMIIPNYKNLIKNDLNVVKL